MTRPGRRVWLHLVGEEEGEAMLVSPGTGQLSTPYKKRPPRLDSLGANGVGGLDSNGSSAKVRSLSASIH